MDGLARVKVSTLATHQAALSIALFCACGFMDACVDPWLPAGLASEVGTALVPPILPPGSLLEMPAFELWRMHCKLPNPRLLWFDPLVSRTQV